MFRIGILLTMDPTLHYKMMGVNVVHQMSQRQDV